MTKTNTAPETQRAMRTPGLADHHLERRLRVRDYNWTYVLYCPACTNLKVGGTNKTIRLDWDWGTEQARRLATATLHVLYRAPAKDAPVMGDV
jgi:hypothetical protein